MARAGTTQLADRKIDHLLETGAKKSSVAMSWRIQIPEVLSSLMVQTGGWGEIKPSAELRWNTGVGVSQGRLVSLGGDPARHLRIMTKPIT